MTAPDSDVTLGEVYRLLGETRRENARLFDAVNRRIDGLNIVHADTYEAERSSDRARIATLEDRSRWISRALGGAMATLLVTMGGNAIYLLQVHK